MEIGSTVKRDVTGYLQDEIGVIVEIDAARNRARVKWSDKRTWYNMGRLILVKA
jgi:hypothetical protein